MRSAKSNRSGANVSALEHGSKFLDSKACNTIESAAPEVLRSDVYLKNKLGIFSEKNNIAKTKAASVSTELETIRSQQRVFAMERGRPPNDRGRAAQRFYEQNPELLQRKNELARMRKATNDQAQKSAAALAAAEAQITNLFK